MVTIDSDFRRKLKVVIEAAGKDDFNLTGLSDDSIVKCAAMLTLCETINHLAWGDGLMYPGTLEKIGMELDNISGAISSLNS